MIIRGLSPLNAEPILGLVRAHARRTALGRLGVVYEIVPQPGTPPKIPLDALGSPADNNWHGLIDAFGAKPQPQGLLSLGEALFIDSIIMGGVDGEQLPMTLDRGVELNMEAHQSGALVNLVG